MHCPERRLYIWSPIQSDDVWQRIFNSLRSSDCSNILSVWVPFRGECVLIAKAVIVGCTRSGTDPLYHIGLEIPVASNPVVSEYLEINEDDTDANGFARLLGVFSEFNDSFGWLGLDSDVADVNECNPDYDY